MVLPTSPPASMSVGANIYVEFDIPASSTRSISQDLFPLVGGTAGSQCFLGASFSGKSARPLYSTIKGTGTDRGYGIAVDSSRNIYVTGQYTSTTAVPINTFGNAPTASGMSLPVASGTDMFVIKWNASGTVAGYTTIQGTGTDIGSGIAVDSSQRIYVIGQYNSTTAVPINTFGTAPSSSGMSLPVTTGTDTFVIKWNADGTVAGYSTLNGNSRVLGNGIAVDSSQNIYVIGEYATGITVPIKTFGTAPTSSGMSLPISTLSEDVFVIKWNASGTVAGYSTIDNTSNKVGRSIAVDSSQNIYVSGQYISTTNVPINTFGTAPSSSGISLPIPLTTTSADMFVIKWNAAGTVAGYSTIRGTGTDIGFGIAVDSSQNIYVTGQYTSSVAPGTVPINTFGTAPSSSGISLPVTTGNDMFVIKWNAAGTVAGYSNIKGTGGDNGRSIAVDSSQNIYVTGQYNSTGAVTINTFGTAPTSSGMSLPAAPTSNDVFVIKWNAAGTVAGYSTIQGTGTDIGFGIAINSSQHVYVTGQYDSTTAVTINTFGTAPTSSGISLPVSSGFDMFLIKWTT